ncbi:MAG: MBL fold metallo-hydrolase [Oligoflexales bacterium]
MKRFVLGMVFGVLALTTGSSAKNLELEVFTSDAAGFHATSTLIKGEKEAILIDGQFTLSAAHRLTAQILESGKELKAVYITHAHPDHYFGMEVIQRTFPNVKFYATPEIAAQAKILGPQKLAAWKPMYGNNLTSAPLTPESFNSDSIVLEGQAIKIIKLKSAEIENAVVFHIPSLNAVIAGDAVYNGVHVWLAETDAARRKTWLENLATIRALNPKIVVAGHKTPNAKDSIASLKATGDYIKNFDAALAKTKNANELQQTMLLKYKSLALPIILELAAKAASGESVPH